MFKLRWFSVESGLEWGRCMSSVRVRW